jgi:hypothetical protein
MKTKHIVSLIWACLIINILSAQKEGTLSNQDIVSMISAGLSPNIIKAAINKSKTNFDLSTAGLVQLKKSGMPDDILLAMIGKNSIASVTPVKDSLLSMPAGIYYKSSDHYKFMEPGVLSSAATTGVGGTLKKAFSMVISFNVKAGITGIHSALIVGETKPEFLFILDYPARSPEEFYLVRLIATQNSRQITFQKSANAAGAIVINDSLKISCTNKKLQNGIYEVSPSHPLPPGEYCFIYSASSLYQGSQFKAFDFSIEPKL